MLDELQKKELIRKAFVAMYDKTGIEEVRKEIWNAFLQDTQNGKLYKYRSVSKYALHNLKSGTLYCAKPSSINDPFDCKLGLDMSFTVFGWVMEGLKDVMGYCVKFTQVYEGNISIEDCEQNEQEVYKKWMESDKICSFIKECANENSVEGDFNDVLEKMDVLVEMMIGFTSDAGVKSCLLEFIREWPELKKEFADMSDEQQQSISKGDISVKNLALAYEVENEGDEISLIAEVESKRRKGDADWGTKMEKSYDDVYKTIAQAIDASFRVGCLCGDYTNCLMWSHYAESHKGFCMEYDLSSWIDKNQEIWVLPVVYSEERVKLPGGAFIASKEGNKKAGEALFQALLTKDRVWSYEGEWRIITPSAVDTVDMPKISCVYIGAECDEIDKGFIIDIAREQSIPVKQMVMDRGEYRVYAQNI